MTKWVYVCYNKIRNQQRMYMKNLICLLLVLATMVACDKSESNPLGPENDPTLEITAWNVPDSGDFRGTLQKVCVFPARVVSYVRQGDTYAGDVLVVPISNRWNTQIRLRYFSQKAALKTSDLIYIKAFAFADDRKSGRYSWEYYPLDENGRVID